MGRFGRFRIKEKIGEGPRAVVFSAEADEGACAVKILKPSVLPRSLSHRKKLVQLLKGLPRIEHQSVVRVIEAGERDGRVYVAMELMQCPTLAQMLAGQERPPERDVIMFSRQIAQALETGREANFYHGDLVAENVFIVASNRIKVSDFAIKKYLSQVPKDAEIGPRPEAGDQQKNGEEEWATAEELLRTRSQSVVTLDMQEDYASLGVLMLKLLSMSVPERKDDEHLEDYRERLRGVYRPLALPSSGVNPHVAEVVRRLLTPSGFASPSDVVVELASAMIFQRRSMGAQASPSQETQLYGPDSAPPARPAPPPGAETAREAAPPDLRPAKEPATDPPAARGAETVADEMPGQVRGDEATPLFVWHGDSRGEFFVLREGEELALGRDPDQCHFTIAEALISRRHCTLSKKDGELWVRDAKSANGTFVNERRVESARLSPGDVVRIGNCRISVAVSFPEEP